MGFFNHLFGKKENTAATKESGEAVVTENVTAQQQEEKNRDSYTFMIEQVFGTKTGGCIVAGIVRNGAIQTGDDIFILGRGRKVLNAKVSGLENPEVGRMEIAQKGTPAGILLEGTDPSLLHRGDVITNVEPNTEDINKPVENPRLKGLLRQAAGNPAEEIMNLVYEEIAMNTKFLSVMLLSEEPEAKEDGSAEFKKDSLMQLPLLSAPDGAKFYPAFTDWQELKKWEDMKEPKTLLITFDDYAAMVLKNPEIQGVVVNPFSENMMIERKLLEHLRMKKDMLLKGSSMQQVENDTEVALSEPVNVPGKMIEEMLKVMKTQQAVEKAWLRLMKKGEEISYLLVVDISLPVNQETIFESIANGVRPYLNGMYINMISYQKEFGKKAVEGVAPVYEK